MGDYKGQGCKIGIKIIMERVIAMLRGGLVSITFRHLTPREIVNLVKKSGLEGIEWGGDVHVPHGNLSVARQVATMTKEEGLAIAAYGSYYRVGCQEQDNVPNFEAVLETALELQAPLIRVWAGNKGSDEADESFWDKVIEDSIRIGDMAQKENILIAYEYHGDTLTDTLESALKLMKLVNHKNIRSYWQPLSHHGLEDRLIGLKQILPWLENIHVYHWASYTDRFSLDEGSEEWFKYMDIIKGLPGERYALIEFVKDDREEAFLQDAETLKKWLYGK